MQELRSWCGALLVAGLLVGCGAGVTPNSTPSADPLTFQTTSLPVGYLGEDFNAPVAVLGGVGAYGYRVAGGSLPPGLKLSGTAIVGKPTKTGAYTFSIEANDSNLSSKVQQYTINVSEMPPLAFALQLPPAEIRGETRVPLLIRAPRTVRAARVQWDVGKDVTVTQVQADGNNVVFWKQSGTMLTVDLGFKTLPKSEARVALVSVKPAGPVNLSSQSQTLWYQARDGAGKLLVDKSPPAPAPAATPTTTPPATPGKEGTVAPGVNPNPADPAKTPAPADPASPAPATTTPNQAPTAPPNVTPTVNPAVNPTPSPTAPPTPTPPGGK